MWLINQTETTGDRPWVSPKQNADLVLGLRDLLLTEDGLGLGLLQQQVGLAHVSNCTIATLKFDGIKLHSLFVGDNVLLCEVQLIVELPQLEVCSRDVGD